MIDVQIYVDEFCQNLTCSATAPPTVTSTQSQDTENDNEPSNRPTLSTQTQDTENDDEPSTGPNLSSSQIKIGTGFGEIFWKHLVITDDVIGITDSMLDNGKDLIAANHIRNVIDNLTLKEISGIALPQTNIREDPYKMFINYDQDRKITRKDCKCDWGGGTVHTLF